MKKQNIPYFLFFLVGGFYFTAHAATIVVIQNEATPFHRKFLAGFSSVATEPVSAFPFEPKKEKILANQFKKMAPDLVLTIGNVPLGELVLALPSTPFIIEEGTGGEWAKKANIVLLEKTLPISTGISLLQLLLPERSNIGTFYNPQHSQKSFDELIDFAGKQRMKVASIKIDKPNDVASYIQAFSGKIDLFYFLNDPTLSQAEASRSVFNFTERMGIPVVSLNPEHIHLGALVTVNVDPIEWGEQTWNVAKGILQEKKIPQMSIEIPSKSITISLSFKACSKFGVGPDLLNTFLDKNVKQNYRIHIEP